MTIKEIEALSGMERANIRFYEREGLISPERLDNGYRDYSEADLQILLRVKLLRSLHISLEDIKGLKNGRLDLADTLEKQIEALDRERQDAGVAEELCRAIRSDRATFAQLDAEKYLDDLRRAAQESESGYFEVRDDRLPQVYHPFRRYFARMLDVSLYGLLWSVVLAFGLHVNLSSPRSAIANLLNSFMALILMVIFEPLWLRVLGTTPGKAIFGLKIEAPDGRRLTYAQGFERAWGVFGAGMGYQIPIYSLVRLWKSFNRCLEGEVLSWDEAVSYTIRDKKPWRGFLYLAACAAVFALFAALLTAQRLPPNRGALTLSQFAENYNYYADYFDLGSGGLCLDENGKWAEKPRVNATYVIDLFPRERPEFQFTLEDGFVTGVSFEIVLENHLEGLGSYESEMLLIALSFAAAENEIGLFSNMPSRIATQIEGHAFSDFSFTEGEAAFYCDTEYAGYRDFSIDFLIPLEDAEEAHFRQIFSVSKAR